MQVEEEIPMCGSCGHRHIQGVKCSICGHVGKSQIFTKMKMRANEKRSFRIEAYNGSKMSSEQSKFDVIASLRRILGTELGGNVDQEFNITEEQSSYHVIGLVGDCPVSITRFNVATTEVGLVLHIDRFMVLNEYRQSRIAYKVLISIFQQFNGLSTVTVLVPINSWVSSKLKSFGFSAESVTATNSSGNMEVLQCVFTQQGNGSLASLMSFLLTKVNQT